MSRSLVIGPALYFVQTDNGWYMIDFRDPFRGYTPREYARAVKNLEAHIEVINPPPATLPATEPEDHYRTAEEALAELKMYEGSMEAVKERFLESVEMIERRGKLSTLAHTQACRDILAYIEELESNRK